MKPSLQLKLSQHLALTPQLQQSIKLLQLSTLELNQEIEKILLENPMIERDEPEANLNPKLMRTVVQILIELQRLGVQLFITTHNYNLLKEFDLQLQAQDQVLFHSLYRDAQDSMRAASFADYDSLQPNAIDDTLAALADREIRQQMGELGQ